MESNIRSIRRAWNQRKAEDGLTLIELIVVVLIVGILSGIALMFFANQTKSAIKAGVKSDVSNNRSQILNDKTDPSGLYITSNKFEERAVRTSENIVGYSVSPDRTEACTWASYRFSDAEVYSYHFDTATGNMSEGVCNTVEGWSTTVLTPSGSSDETEDENGPVVPGESEEEDLNPAGGSNNNNNDEEPGDNENVVDPAKNLYGFSVNDERLELDVSIYKDNKAKVCFTVDIKNVSSVPVEWAVNIDKTVEPFLGNEFGNETVNSRSFVFSQTSSTATLDAPSRSKTVSPGGTETLTKICVRVK